jgi:hypothetical protein
MSNLNEPVRASFLRPGVNLTEAERSSSLAFKQNQLSIRKPLRCVTR